MGSADGPWRSRFPAGRGGTVCARKRVGLAARLGVQVVAASHPGFSGPRGARSSSTTSTLALGRQQLAKPCWPRFSKGGGGGGPVFFFWGAGGHGLNERRVEVDPHRPLWKAGERLGFLPVTCSRRWIPTLRPRTTPCTVCWESTDRTTGMLERGVIEVAAAGLHAGTHPG